jgi:hypothetical protein
MNPTHPPGAGCGCSIFSQSRRDGVGYSSRQARTVFPPKQQTPGEVPPPPQGAPVSRLQAYSSIRPYEATRSNCCSALSQSCSA